MKTIIDTIEFAEALELWLKHKHGIEAHVDPEGGGEWDYEPHKMITWKDGKRTETHLDYPSFEFWFNPIKPKVETEEAVETGETTSTPNN